MRSDPLPLVEVVLMVGVHIASGAMEAEMQAIAPMIVGFVALTAVSVQAAPSPNQENWSLLGRPLSLHAR
jgi:hypothetical protein